MSERGASDVEVAAIAVALALVTAAPPPERRTPSSAWADPAAGVRMPLRPGPGAWRRSALPGLS